MTMLRRNDRTCREPAATREDVVVKAVHYSAIPYTWCGFRQEGDLDKKDLDKWDTN